MVGAIPPAHIFLVVTGKFIKNYIIKLSEGKCNFNEKNDYVNNFDGRLPRDFEILGWCPAGPVLTHGEKVPL